MGSINPVFILPRALQERGAEIAAGVHASVTLGAGQFCTNPGLILTTGDERFVRELETRIAATPAATMLTPAIADAYRAGVASFASIANRRVFVEAEGGAALFTADAENFLAHPELMHENFGPSTLVVECDSRARMLDAARALEGQLTVTIHAAEGEIDEYRDLLEILETRQDGSSSMAIPPAWKSCRQWCMEVPIRPPPMAARPQWARAPSSALRAR
jgi:NADP-dependent aldehyde dehydrogenase